MFVISFVVALCSMWALFPILSVQSLLPEEDVKFNKIHTGVVFSPYVKNWENGSIPKWKDYTLEDIKFMLNLVSTKFQRITTYGMGVGDINVPWNEGDRVALTAVAAAQINLKNKRTILSVSQGIWHNNDKLLYEREAENAFASSKEANALFPNTVTSIVLSTFSFMASYRNWKDAVEFLVKYRPEAVKLDLKLGLRLDICDQIVQKLRPEDDNLHSATFTVSGPTTPKPLSDIQLIANNSDILICTVFPSANMVGDGTQKTVDVLGKQMAIVEKALKMENKDLTVTWETGWPSAGVSKFGSVNTARNLRNFWKQMGAWALKSKANLYMFAAFDEPWKTNPSSSKEITDPEGPNGAESHFGWWRLKNNEDMMSYVEKDPEPEMSAGLGPGAVAAIILGLLTPIIAFLLWRLYKARETIERLSEQDIKEFVEGVPGERKDSGEAFTVDSALHMPYNRSFELSLDAFVIDEKDVLGSGAFGIVYKGKITGMVEPVAFKKPNKNISVSQLKNVLSEIKIMIYIGKHENVVVLLGAHTDGLRDGVVYIASECCALGSLESHLRSIPRTFMVVDNSNPSGAEVEMQNAELEVRYVNHVTKPIENLPKSTVPIPSILRWSYEIANGMEYLAAKKVIHADLATRNVLLTADGTAKITDFGLSRRLYEYTQYVKSNNQEPLPWRWMAIESLRNLSFSSLSDVWSYGITLWEIFSLGDVPYPGLSWNVEFVDQLEKGLRMHMPKYATVPIYNDTMILCWHLDPDLRPTFTDLKNYFQTLVYEERKLGNN